MNAPATGTSTEAAWGASHYETRSSTSTVLDGVNENDYHSNDYTLPGPHEYPSQAFRSPRSAVHRRRGPRACSGQGRLHPHHQGSQVPPRGTPGARRQEDQAGGEKPRSDGGGV